MITFFLDVQERGELKWNKTLHILVTRAAFTAHLLCSECLLGVISPNAYYYVRLSRGESPPPPPHISM